MKKVGRRVCLEWILYRCYFWFPRVVVCAQTQCPDLMLKKTRQRTRKVALFACCCLFCVRLRSVFAFAFALAFLCPLLFSQSKSVNVYCLISHDSFDNPIRRLNCLIYHQIV